MAKNNDFSDLDSFDVDAEFNLMDGPAEKSLKDELLGMGINTAKGVRNGLKNRLQTEFPYASNLVSETIDTVDDFKRLKDDLMGEVTPAINTLKGITLRVMPMAERLIPKKWYDAIETKLKESYEKPGESQEVIEQRARKEEITNSLGQIFEGQLAVQKQYQIREDTQRVLDQRMRNIQFKASHELMSKTNAHVATIANFITGTYIGYLKKSLELKYQGLFLMRDIHKTSLALAKVVEHRLDALVQNTGLPDSAKFTGKYNHGVLAGIKRGNRYTSSGMYLQGFRRQFTENIHKNIMDSVKTFTQQYLPMMDMATGMMESFGVEKESWLGLAGKILGFAGSLGADAWLGKKLEGKRGNRYRRLDSQMRRWPEYLFQKIRDFGEKRRMTGGLLGWLANLVPEYRKGGVENTFEEGIGEAVPFDNTTRQTIVEVIPAHLERIGDYVVALSKSLVPTLKVTHHTFDIKTRSIEDVETATEHMYEVAGLQTKKERANLIQNEYNTVRNAFLANNKLDENNEADKEKIEAFDKNQELWKRFFFNCGKNNRYFKLEEIARFIENQGAVDSKYQEEVFSGMTSEEALTLATELRNFVINTRTGVRSTELIETINEAISYEIRRTNISSGLYKVAEEMGQRRHLGHLIGINNKINEDEEFKIYNQKLKKTTSYTYDPTGKRIDTADTNWQADNVKTALEDEEESYKAAVAKGNEAVAKWLINQAYADFPWAFDLINNIVKGIKAGAKWTSAKIQALKEQLSGLPSWVTETAKSVQNRVIKVRRITQLSGNTFKLELDNGASLTHITKKSYDTNSMSGLTEIMDLCKQKGYVIVKEGRDYEKTNFIRQFAEEDEEASTVDSNVIPDTSSGGHPGFFTSTQGRDIVVNTVIPNKLDTIINILRGTDTDRAGEIKEDVLSSTGAGGVIPGVSMSGDQINIKANSGEWILNRNQMANLAISLGVEDAEDVFDIANDEYDEEDLNNEFASGGKVGRGNRRNRRRVRRRPMVPTQVAKPTESAAKPKSKLQQIISVVSDTVKDFGSNIKRDFTIVVNDKDVRSVVDPLKEKAIKLKDVFLSPDDLAQYVPEDYRDEFKKLYNGAAKAGKSFKDFLGDVKTRFKVPKELHNVFDHLVDLAKSEKDADTRRSNIGAYLSKAMAKTKDYANGIADIKEVKALKKKMDQAIDTAKNIKSKAAEEAKRIKEDVKNKGLIEAGKNAGRRGWFGITGMLKDAWSKVKIGWMRFKHSKFGKWLLRLLPDDVKDDLKKSVIKAKGDVKKGMENLKKDLKIGVKEKPSQAKIDQLIKEAQEAEKLGEWDLATEILEEAAQMEQDLKAQQSAKETGVLKDIQDHVEGTKKGKPVGRKGKKTTKTTKGKKSSGKGKKEEPVATPEEPKSWWGKLGDRFKKLNVFTREKLTDAKDELAEDTKSARNDLASMASAVKTKFKEIKEDVAAKRAEAAKEKENENTKLDYKGDAESQFHADFRLFTKKLLKDNAKTRTAIRMIALTKGGGVLGGLLSTIIKTTGGMAKAWWHTKAILLRMGWDITKLTAGAMWWGTKGVGRALKWTGGKLIGGIRGTGRGIKKGYRGFKKWVKDSWRQAGIDDGEPTQEKIEQLLAAAEEAEKNGDKALAEELFNRAAAMEQKLNALKADEAERAGRGSRRGFIRGMFNSVGGWFKRKPNFVDIYEKDNVAPDKILLTAKKQEDGEAFFKDGSIVKSSRTIEEPVFIKGEDGNPKCVITQEQIDNGLVDVENNLLYSGAKSGWSKFREANKEGGIKGWAKSAWLATKGFFQGVGEIFGIAREGNSGDKKVPILGRRVGIDLVLSQLERMYDLLNTKFGQDRADKEKAEEEARRAENDAKSMDAQEQRDAIKRGDTGNLTPEQIAALQAAGIDPASFVAKGKSPGSPGSSGGGISAGEAAVAIATTVGGLAIGNEVRKAGWFKRLRTWAGNASGVRWLKAQIRSPLTKIQRNWRAANIRKIRNEYFKAAETAAQKTRDGVKLTAEELKAASRSNMRSTVRNLRNAEKYALQGARANPRHVPKGLLGYATKGLGWVGRQALRPIGWAWNQTKRFGKWALQHPNVKAFFKLSKPTLKGVGTGLQVAGALVGPAMNLWSYYDYCQKSPQEQKAYEDELAKKGFFGRMGASITDFEYMGAMMKMGSDIIESFYNDIEAGRNYNRAQLAFYTTGYYKFGQYMTVEEDTTYKQELIELAKIFEDAEAKINDPNIRRPNVSTLMTNPMLANDPMEIEAQAITTSKTILISASNEAKPHIEILDAILETARDRERKGERPRGLSPEDGKAKQAARTSTPAVRPTTVPADFRSTTVENKAHPGSTITTRADAHDAQFKQQNATIAANNMKEAKDRLARESTPINVNVSSLDNAMAENNEIGRNTNNALITLTELMRQQIVATTEVGNRQEQNAKEDAAKILDLAAKHAEATAKRASTPKPRPAPPVVDPQKKIPALAAMAI